MAPTTKSGQTFIEIILVIALIGLIAAIALPNLVGRRRDTARKEFASHLSTLVLQGWQEAVSSTKTNRVLLDFQKRFMRLEQETDERDRSGEMVYKQVPGAYGETQFLWPETLSIKDLYIDGADELHSARGRVEQTWFFIFPDGSSQHIVINLFDTADTKESEAGSRMSVVLNPFTLRITTNDTFTKP